MFAEKMLQKNSLAFLHTAEGADGTRMGLVVSRAGLGKTSILVQVALDYMLRGKEVLHVSIGSSLDKARTWYDDIMHSLAVDGSGAEMDAFRDELLRRRMIMTFNESGFNRPKFEERLNDLVYQGVFRPECVVVDGFDFTAVGREEIADLHEMAETMSLQLWFSAISHREDRRVSESGIPAPCHQVDDLFDTVIILKPAEKIMLDIVKDKGSVDTASRKLYLDPVTLLVQDS